MGKRAWLLGSSIAVLAAFIAACSSNSGSPAAPSGAGGSTEAKPGGTSAYQLNLSHIECVEGGQVEIHFVLLHVPDGITPGSLTWSNNNVAQAPVAPTRRTGNVWHYNILVAPGTYNVTSASVLVNGVTVNLHNPGAYAGQYLCGPTTCTGPPQIPSGWAAEGAVTCRVTAVETPSAECGLFGLAPDGRDTGNGTSSQAASKDAVLAVVRDGPCDLPPGAFRYTYFTPVTQGEILNLPGSPISHITYCQCPAPVDVQR